MGFLVVHFFSFNSNCLFKVGLFSIIWNKNNIALTSFFVKMLLIFCQHYMEHRCTLIFFFFVRNIHYQVILLMRLVLYVSDQIWKPHCCLATTPMNLIDFYHQSIKFPFMHPEIKRALFWQKVIEKNYLLKNGIKQQGARIILWLWYSVVVNHTSLQIIRKFQVDDDPSA